MTQPPTSECTDVRAAPGTFDDLDDVLQAALKGDEFVTAVFRGPIEQSTRDMLLALTGVRAIAIVSRYDAHRPWPDPPPLRIPPSDCAWSIDRSELGFATPDGIEPDLIGGTGRCRYGIFIDGFPGTMTIATARLSEAQIQTWRAFLAKWGGTVAAISSRQADQRYEYWGETTPGDRFGGLILVLFGLFLLPFQIIEAAVRWIRRWKSKQR